MRRILKCALVGAVLAACFWPQVAAHACTPPPGWRPPPIAERYAAAGYVLRGTIAAADAPHDRASAPPFAALSDPLTPEVGIMNMLFAHFYRYDAPLTGRRFSAIEQGYYAVIEVDRYYKGEGAARVVVRGFGYGPDCLNVAWSGETHVFFANGSSPFLSAMYLGPLTAIVDVDTATTEALALLNAEPFVPDRTATHIWLPVLLTTMVAYPFGLRAAWRLMAGQGMMTGSQNRKRVRT